MQDPFSGQLKAVWQESDGDVVRVVSSILAIEEIFGADLMNEEKVVDGITFWLEAIVSQGIVEVLNQL